MKDAFYKLNPLTEFLFFFAVIALSMTINQPVFIILAYAGAAANCLFYNKKKTIAFLFRFSLPMTALIAVINPLINHEGMTFMFYLPWGNPVTLEALLYGVASGFMISTVMLWFSFLNEIMTSDKLIYLFGRISPSLSLIISMTLRFIPRFSAKYREARAVNGIGESKEAGVISKATSSVKCFSMVISRFLEGSIETADSMKGRGYGLKGRTAYAKYRFRAADFVLMSLIISLSSAVVVLRITRLCHFRYFPSVKGELLSPFSLALYVLTLILVLLPLAYSAEEGLIWKKSRLAV